jgi:hypothetical protein
MAYRAPDPAQSVAQFLDRYDQRGECRAGLCGQFRKTPPIIRQHFLQRGAGVFRLDTAESGQGF